MISGRVSERFELPVPIEAMVGKVSVQVVDVSATGFKIHHRDHLPPKGEPIELRFRWNGAPITVYCSAVWTTIHRLARTTTERPTLSSGLHIESVAALARKTLDAMLESLRANRAQTAAYTQNSSSSTTIGPYLFCEFRNGEWRQSRTFTREQPGEGFTLSATEDAGQVARLCAAYAGGDGDTRKLIRTLAALSLKSQSDELATV